METLIEIWLKFGYVVYWMGWFGSMAIWNTSTMLGIGIGVIAFILWFILLNVFSKINGDGWVWNW